MNVNKTSVVFLQELECVKNLDKIKKDFVLKLDNRKRLTNYLSICRSLGFEKFCEVSSPSSINREVIKEIISLES